MDAVGDKQASTTVRVKESIGFIVPFLLGRSWDNV